MEPVQALGRAALLGVLASLLAGAGCTSANKVTQDVTDSFKQAIAPEPSKPASQIVCFWQRRLQTLPDPTRDGAQAPGIVGQVFLISPDSQPAEVNGDLAIVVYDVTPRPPGTEAMKPEMWHYTRDTLRKLATTDERFGRCYAIFLPWPNHWKDVTTVKILARYQSPGNPDLYASEVRMALDLSTGGPVWKDLGSGQPGDLPPAAPGGVDTRSVPDASKVLQAIQATSTPTPPSAPAANPALAAPIAPPAAPSSSPAIVAPPIVIPAQVGK